MINSLAYVYGMYVCSLLDVRAQWGMHGIEAAGLDEVGGPAKTPTMLALPRLLCA